MPDYTRGSDEHDSCFVFAAVVGALLVFVMVVAWIVGLGVEAYEYLFIEPTALPTRDIDPNSCYGLSTAECRLLRD